MQSTRIDSTYSPHLLAKIPLMRKLYYVSVLLILVATGFTLYGHHAVYRYPALTIDPTVRGNHYQQAHNWSASVSGAYIKAGQGAHFRAFQPRVALQIHAEKAVNSIHIEVENVHPQARLTLQGLAPEQLLETTDGLRRTITASSVIPGTEFFVSWQFPKKTGYRFVAIGDTGGDRELAWGLERAAQLDADFILHLGDAYYDTSEYDQVGTYLNDSSVPVYTANGNHDFQGPQGNVIEVFLQDIGPLNARFSLLGHCFINLDTGAFMYPSGKGERGALLAAEIVNHRRNPAQCTDYIVFTHKPMVLAFEADFPQQDHSLYSWHARPLIEQLQQLGPVTVLAGHIHKDFEFEQDGIKTYVTGSGLAHQDLLSGKKIAKVLIGEIKTGQPLTLEWAFNEMPLEYHCSKRLYRGFVEAGNPLSEVFERCDRE